MADGFLIIAGIGGILISILHGIIGHRKILTRITGLSTTLKKVNTAVFQISTFYWFIAGVALLITPFSFTQPHREAIAITCAIIYLIGALANLWATQGKHFGWPILGSISLLAFFGVNGA